MRLRLRFPHSEIEKWAAQYSYASDAAIEDVIAPAARRQGYLTRDQFLTIAEWKTARSRSRCRKNDAGYVKEVTSDWPTASVILHFCDRGRYPIVDVRAMWSLGVTTPQAIDFPVWMEIPGSCAGSRRTPASRCARSTGRSGSTRRCRGR